jgi:hypothetical protein
MGVLKKQVFGSAATLAGTGCQTFAFVRKLSFFWFFLFDFYSFRPMNMGSSR